MEKNFQNSCFTAKKLEIFIKYKRWISLPSERNLQQMLMDSLWLYSERSHIDALKIIHIAIKLYFKTDDDAPNNYLQKDDF